MKTGNSHDGSQSAPAGPIELVADVWFIIMSLLSPSDVVCLSHTCKTLLAYSQCHHVWRSALAKHRFLPKSYPHLRHAPTSVIRRQLVTTERLDAAFSRSTLRPVRSYSFPLEFPGVFQGMKFLPGGDWLVLLFHSRMLNPARHSNICLFKLPMTGSGTMNAAPDSVILQSERCWLQPGPRDGPYKSSHGDDLLLLRTFAKNIRTFAICHLDTKTPSVKITLTVHTTLRTRNHVAAGDYVVFGWITDDRKHLLRIMKLGRDYSQLEKDVTVEIDCPPGNDGRLMIRYDLRLSGKSSRLLLVSTRLMAAYDISDNALTPGGQSSPVKLETVWKYSPENISFGRILHVFHESAIVTLYQGKIRFVHPDIDDPKPNAKTIVTYDFSTSKPYSAKFPAVMTAQRLFWPLRFPQPDLTSAGSRHFMETAMLPTPRNEECKIDRVLVDHDEGLVPVLACDAQDWDELSGTLCVRSVRSKSLHDLSWRNASWRVTILHMV